MFNEYPTFQPSINRRSKRVASVLAPLVDRQFEEQQKRKERMEQLAAKIDSERDREVTFAPRLSKAPAYLDTNGRVPLAERSVHPRSSEPPLDPEATYRPRINTEAPPSSNPSTSASAAMDSEAKRRVRELWRDYADGPSMSTKGVLNVLATFGITDDTRPDLVDKFFAAMNVDEGDASKRYVQYDRFLKVMASVVRNTMGAPPASSATDHQQQQQRCSLSPSAVNNNKSSNNNNNNTATTARLVTPRVHVPIAHQDPNATINRHHPLAPSPSSASTLSRQRSASASQPQRQQSASRQTPNRNAFNVEDDEDEDDDVNVRGRGGGGEHIIYPSSSSFSPQHQGKGRGAAYFATSASLASPLHQQQNDVNSRHLQNDADSSPMPHQPVNTAADPLCSVDNEDGETEASLSHPLRVYSKVVGAKLQQHQQQKQQQDQQNRFRDPMSMPSVAHRASASPQQQPQQRRAHSQPNINATSTTASMNRDELSEVSFRPTINPSSYSEALLAKRDQQGGLARPKESEKGLLKQQALKKALEAKEMEACSFAPKTLGGRIDPLVAQIMSTKRVATSASASPRAVSSTSMGGGRREGSATSSVSHAGLSMSPQQPTARGDGNIVHHRRAASTSASPTHQHIHGRDGSAAVHHNSTTDDKEAVRIIIQMPPDPPGFEKVIKRLADGRARAVPKFEDALRSASSQRPSATSKGSGGDGGADATTLEPTEPKPFHLASEARQQERARRKPLLYVDVNLPHQRTGRIGVYKGDDPHILAHNFCVTYGLDTDALAQLTVMLQQKIDQTLRANAIRKVWA